MGLGAPYMVLWRVRAFSAIIQGVTNDEKLTPTLENVIVITWLRLVHPDLPALIKQRYGTELRSQTLASLKPEISQAILSWMDICWRDGLTEMSLSAIWALLLRYQQRVPRLRGHQDEGQHDRNLH